MHRRQRVVPAPSGGIPSLPASGAINGWNVAAVPAASPPDLICEIIEASPFVFSHYVDGVAQEIITFAPVDPEDGSLWIDDSGFSANTDYAYALAWALDAYQGNSFEGPNKVFIRNTAIGSSASLSGSATGGNVSVTGGGSGTDYSPAAGYVEDVVLIAGASGKVTKLASALSAKIFTASSVTSWNGTVTLYLLDGGTNQTLLSIPQTALAAMADGDYSIDDLVGLGATKWDIAIAGGLENGALRLRFATDDYDTKFEGGLLEVNCLVTQE